jgi:hypothetical protein
MYNNREYQKTYINTSASSSIFSGRGTLGGVCVNTTASGSITLYDGTSPFAILKASIAENEYCKDILISNGLIVSTNAASDLTVKWVKG